jgi:hypothetical protein
MNFFKKIKKYLKFYFRYFKYRRQLNNLQDLLIVSPFLDKDVEKRILKFSAIKNDLFGTILKNLTIEDYNSLDLVSYMVHGKRYFK